ncbi:MAG: hypothetical protein AB8C46_03465 [Burkholderiaceae bacterium]
MTGIALCSASSVSYASNNDWRLDIDDSDNDVEVHTRKRDNGFVEFLGVTRLNTSLSSLVALLRDVEHMPNWSYRTSMAMQLEQVSARERIIYSVAGMPWPFKDRDLVVRSRLQQDPVSLTVLVTAEALPDYLPADPAYVRVPFLQSSWAFEPLSDGTVEVRFKGYGDGGGSLSKGFFNWFSALVVSEAPHQTLLGLRRMVRQKRYQQASVAIIQEPVRTSTVKGDARNAPQGISNRLSMMSPSSK